MQTGIAPVAVQRVRLRDRGAGENGERVRFTSAIVELCGKMGDGEMRKGGVLRQVEACLNSRRDAGRPTAG